MDYASFLDIGGSVSSRDYLLAVGNRSSLGMKPIDLRSRTLWSSFSFFMHSHVDFMWWASSRFSVSSRPIPPLSFGFVIFVLLILCNLFCHIKSYICCQYFLRISVGIFIVCSWYCSFGSSSIFTMCALPVIV